MLLIAQRRSPRRDLGKDLKVRHLLHSLSYTLRMRGFIHDGKWLFP